MKTYRIRYKEYDYDGRVAFHHMTMEASDEKEAENEFNRIWGLSDVHIIKIEEL